MIMFFKSLYATNVLFTLIICLKKKKVKVDHAKTTGFSFLFFADGIID